MTRTKVHILQAMLLLIVFSGCKQNKETDYIEADKQAIRELYFNRYFQGVNENDQELFISSWATDATRMEQGFFPIVGKEKIKAHFRNIFDNINNLEIKPYGEIEVELNGDLGFTRGAVTIKGISAADSSEVFLDMKWLDIVKKQSDGTWKIYIDCVNLNPIVTVEPDESDMIEDNSPDPAL